MPPAAISSSRQLPVAALIEGPNIWRGPKPDTGDLEESFGRAPLLAPLIVRNIPGKKHRWEVIAGHRRLAAARARGWSHIEVRVVAADDQLAEQLSLEENLRRKAVKNEPRAMARLLELYRRLHPARPGRPKSGQVVRISALQALSKASGKSAREVRRLARIGAASPQLQKLYARGKVNVLKAERLAGLPRGEQVRQLRLLKMPRTNEQERALEALRYALRIFKKAKPGRTRAEAKQLVAELQRVLR